MTPHTEPLPPARGGSLRGNLPPPSSSTPRRGYRQLREERVGADLAREGQREKDGERSRGRTKRSASRRRPQRGQLSQRRQLGRTQAPAWPARGGYLSEEAGDHLLEGVLVHLVHVHRDPHPRAPATPPRAQGHPSSAAAAGVHARAAKGAWGFFFPSFFKLPKLYCPLRETDRRSRSRPPPPTSRVGGGGREACRRRAGPQPVPGGAWRRLERPRPVPGASHACGSFPPGGGRALPGTSGLCFRVITSPGATE